MVVKPIYVAVHPRICKARRVRRGIDVAYAVEVSAVDDDVAVGCATRRLRHRMYGVLAWWRWVLNRLDGEVEIPKSNASTLTTH